MRPCSLCAGPAQRAFLTRDRNRRITAEPFAYLRCRRCGLLFLEDPPADLGPFYAGDYFGFPSPAQLDDVPLQERGQVALLRRHLTGGHLIEVGPGRGYFGHAAKTAGFDVEAIERDERSCAQLRQVVGVRVTQSERPQEVLRAREGVSAVVLWQVLEHLPQPWEVLDAAVAALRPGGILALATPHPGGLEARLLGGRWPHVDAPRHLQLIPPRALVDRLRAGGLTPLSLFSGDPDARRWCTFAWQRALMNEVSGRLPRAAAFWAGTALAAALWPLERRRLNGPSYTLVMRKGSSAVA